MDFLSKIKLPAKQENPNMTLFGFLLICNDIIGNLVCLFFYIIFSGKLVKIILQLRKNLVEYMCI